MVEKIRVHRLLVLHRRVGHSKLKWRKKRGVTGLRPAAGRAHATTSTACRPSRNGQLATSGRTSRPGRDPLPQQLDGRLRAVLLARGMLMSSTKMTYFFPAIGPPSRFLRRLSSFAVEDVLRLVAGGLRGEGDAERNVHVGIRAGGAC